MGQRLLIVDNDRRFISEHKVGLEAAYEVDFAHGTEGVTQRLAGGEYAAVLICVEVSENKGYALCSAIRRNPDLADLKVVLISAKATEEEYARHQSLKGRADLYLHKPLPSGALVAALGDLVPPRALNPDNPFGDLGEDLGEAWLESLQSELGAAEVAPVEPPLRTAPAVPNLSTVALPVIPSIPAILPPLAAPDPQSGKVELLESRVQDLEGKLQDLGELLARKDQELEDLRRSHQAATVNLDEVERLKLQLQETEEALVGQEKALSAAQAQFDEIADQQQQDRAARQELEARLGEEQRERRKAVERLDHLQAELQEARTSGERQREELESQLRERQARVQEVEEALGRASRGQEELEAARLEAEAREARIQELQAQADSLRSEIDVQRVDIQGLEATLRGQRRELAEQGSRLGCLTRETESLQDILRAAEARAVDAEAQVKTQDEALRAAERAHAEALTRAEEARAELEQQMARSTSDFEAQKMELLRGIDDREAQIGRMNGHLDAQQARLAQLEQEKRELEGQLNETTARLEHLGQALQDLEQGIRRASDLTRPVQ